jgi:RNA polymerase sigma-70 factor (sigma-E family)
MDSWQQTLAGLADGRLAELKRQAFLLCGDEWLAEDLVQETLIRVFCRPSRLLSPRAPEAYLRKVMVNLFIDQARRRSRWTRAAPLLLRAEPVPDIAEQVTVRDAVMTAMDSLSARQRACIVLRFYEDLPVAEVARVLGLQVGTVSRYLSEAVARLGEQLSATEHR